MAALGREAIRGSRQALAMQPYTFDLHGLDGRISERLTGWFASDGRALDHADSIGHPYESGCGNSAA